MGPQTAAKVPLVRGDMRPGEDVPRYGKRYAARSEATDLGVLLITGHCHRSLVTPG